MSTLSVTSVVAALLVLVLGGSLFKNRKQDAFPRGPPGLPFIGNFFKVPGPFSKTGPYLFYRRLADTYGPAIGITAFGEKILVLNELPDAEELLKKRSNIFSSRRRLIFGGKYQARDQRLVMLQYGPLLKKQRAAFADMLGYENVSTFESVLEQETTKLLAEIIASPPAPTADASGTLKLQVKRYIASLIFTLTYGKKLADDQNLMAVLQVLETILADATPGAHLVDTFPILDKLPDWLSPWRHAANAKHQFESDLYVGLARSVRSDMKAGIAQDCFARRLWDQHDEGVFNEETLAYVAGSAFEAAIHTTSGTMMWFIMFMRMFPSVQAKAQKEIDDALLDVYGTTLEPPTLSMLSRLPYCVALVKEVMRWMPVAPGAFPHMATEDTEYKGWNIPKDTLVLPNVLAMHRDPRNYDEPDEFRPERFMAVDTDLASKELFNDGHHGFGFGRRVCPARYLAGKTVFIGAVRLLWSFNIQPVTDKDGYDMPVHETDCPWTIVNEPYDFPVQMTPRSEKHVARVEREWTDVQNTWASLLKSN